MESPLPPLPSMMGPYILQDLVDDLPLDTPENPNVEITCLEFWEENLYVGTSTHELLHFVSLPATLAPGASVEPPKQMYILASRPQPPPTPTVPTIPPYIKKIIVLPTTSTALVLSSAGFLSFYTLPEFTPLSGAPKLKDVAFIGGQDLNEVDEERIAAAEGRQVDAGRGKLFVVLAKGKLRIIRIGDTARLIKDIELKARAVEAVRRNMIVCIATAENYALVDVDNIRQIPLFPISSIPPSDSPSPTKSGPDTPQSLSQTSGSHVRNTSRSHPPRTSSLTPRERRNSSATASKESSATIHNRSSSTGSVRGQTSRQSSRGKIPTARGGKSASKPTHLSPPSPTSSRPLSPSASSQPSSPTARSETGLAAPSSSSKASSVASSTTPSPGSTSPTKTTPIGPKFSVKTEALISKGPLIPHVASPSPSEFLLTTGTTWEDPGVGLFVNVEGDVTRGTISFEKYPDDVLVQGPWVIAVVASRAIEVQRWNMDDGESEGIEGRGVLEMDDNGCRLGLSETIGLPGRVVGAAMAMLRLEMLHLRPGPDLENNESPELRRRNNEERIIAERISTVESSVVAFKGKRICALVETPLVLRLDSLLPTFNDGTPKTRIRNTLKTLRKIDAIEPTTERGFHEVSYIRQKCGMLLLGELLRLETFEGTDIQPDEIILSEEALIESAVDPRVVLAMFGGGFIEDIVLGEGGVWVYGGIRLVFDEICARRAERQVGYQRDTLLLLKRYLAVWRRKKGFGSIADEKEVFATVDVALIRVLLMLDSPEYLPQKGFTMVSEGNVRGELYALVDQDVDEFEAISNLLRSFGRLYVLSILLQNMKMYREVLVTWKKILEEGDKAGEFEDGEEKVRNYLLKLKDRSLVEEFGKWLATRNPKLGTQVFSDDKAKAKFEPEKVLEILKEHAPTAVRSYVSQLVEKGNKKYANDLILLYLDDLIKVLEEVPSASERLRDSYESYRALTSPKPTYREFIADNSLPLVETDGAGDTSETNWWRNRLRFLELLGGESPYDVAKIFGSLVKFREVLVPEMVILYGKEGRHEDAIRLLTHGLKDFDTAINYCLFGGLSIFQTREIITDRDEQKTLFAVLLGEFLKLEDYQERMEQTRNLLERFGGWVDVTHVLQVVPDSWSVEMLSGFLMSALRGLVKERAEASVMKGLRRSENFRMEADYVARCDDIGPTIER
ncbi:hypothetical protein L873DRAFT_1815604 [Choiromyces venosus 120613-1]|uniref:CNH domain-containing protein n=1 Tax=Choiromyces venosus 120613-1 TaxID=1336337 RepID=A0A3N4J5Q2_9PEZI|nr:hypothetical protein L873DRAFT_1815604 [Choiromyces venosus 120613-1]